MNEPRHLTTAELAAGLPEIRRSPADGGSVCVIVVRPDRDLRELPHAIEISPESGLAGDRWVRHCTRKLPDGRICAITEKDGPCLLNFTKAQDGHWKLSGFEGDLSMLRLKM